MAWDVPAEEIRIVPRLLVVFLAVTLSWEAVSLWLIGRHAAAARAGADAVPEAFRGTVSLDEHRKAAAYTVAKAGLEAIDGVVGLVVTFALVLGGADALAAAVSRVAAPGLVADVALLAAITAVGAVAGLPLAAWRSFVVEARFGFNRTTPALFALDLVRRAALAVLIGLPLLAALLFVMRRFQGPWWLVVWIGALGVMLAAPAVYTRLIAPLFNRFERLDDPALVGRIEALLDRSGFRSSGLWTVDASRRSNHGNAFFIGWGRQKRIVLFDTLLAKRSPDEVEAVVAHELGHFRHGHVAWGIARSALVLLLVLAAIGWLTRQPGLLGGFGFRARGDGIALYAASLVVGLVLPILSPLMNAVSRRHEYQADDYARREVGAAPMVSALVNLTRDSAGTLTPDPLYALAHHSHPSVPLRVARLRQASGIPTG